MKISDFIDGRGVTYDTVRKYIVNHPELFKGHIGRTNNIVLDDVAIEILEKKYPFPESSAGDSGYRSQREIAGAYRKIY